MSRPILALLTDFGVRDHYVATMKAVALGICGDVTFVDITHEIEPQDIMSGAFELASCYTYFPIGTIFLVVVDPGVGTARRAIAADAGGYRFVGPDNGVLSLALQQRSAPRIVELTAPKYARPTISRTFEGRDRFAPAAGWIAAGVDIAEFGRTVDTFTHLPIPVPVVSRGLLTGEILRVDRFGNLITNIDRRTLDAFLDGHAARIEAGGQVIPRIVSTYADVPAGDACALIGSSDYLELATNGGSAAAMFTAARGTTVHVRRGA